MMQEVLLKNFRGSSMESDFAKLKQEKQEIAEQARQVVARMLQPIETDDIGTTTFGGAEVFENGTTKGAPATLEFQFSVEGRTFRYGLDVLPGRVHSEYLFEEIDYVEELVFGRENDQVVFNEEETEDNEDPNPEVESDRLLLSSLENDERATLVRQWFQESVQ